MSDTELVRFGEIVDAPDSESLRAELDGLRRENHRLRRELHDAKIEAERAREDADRALGSLRRQLSPLYRSLQAVFGELDAAGVTESPTPTVAAATATSIPAEPRVAMVWEAWKQRLPGGPSRVIDALLVHGEMNSQQLRVAAKMAQQTVYDSIHRLNKLGLINKNGGRYSLKPL